LTKENDLLMTVSNDGILCGLEKGKMILHLSPETIQFEH
jgi:hypothetical protein